MLEACRGGINRGAKGRKRGGEANGRRALREDVK